MNTDEYCYICGHKKKKGILGGWYCPNKHGDGKGEGIRNQPASDPK